MAVRATMAALITRVRRLINDGASPQQFSDQEIQDTLDQSHRRDVTALALTPDPSFTPGLSYLAYTSDLAAWEDAMELQNGNYATISAAGYTALPLVGRWTFAASQAPPVFASGTVYDLHGAAGDLLDQWAAAESLSFDFTSSQNQRFNRSQKADLLAKAAQRQWALAWPRDAAAQRPDMVPAGVDANRTDDRGLPWGTGYGGGR